MESDFQEAESDGFRALGFRELGFRGLSLSPIP